MQSGSSSNGNGEGSSQLLRDDPFDLGSESDEVEVDDPIATYNRDNALLGEDYLADDNTQVSFKRKQKLPAKLSIPGLLSPLSTPAQKPNSGRSTPHLTSERIRKLRQNHSQNISDIDLPEVGTYTNGETHLAEGKEGGPLDWLGDGPRRRVGYDDLTAIDWIFEYTKERQRLRNLFARSGGLLGQFSLLFDASQIWLVLIITGLSSGLLAAAIDVATEWLADLKTGYCDAGVGDGHFYLSRGFCCWGHEKLEQCGDWTSWASALHVSNSLGSYLLQYIFYVAYSVVFAMCAAFLVHRYAIYAKQSGIPEIKTVLGGFVIRRFMGTSTLAVKCLGLCLAVASGMWLGKEGPLVHVACCCANIFMKFSSSLNENEARRREVFSAAAAAGISVAFGSPIGGVLFSLEQLSFYFPDKTMWQSFVCAMVAAVALQASNPFRTSKLVLFEVRYSSGWHGFEMVPFAILGLIGGIYGGVFIKLNMWISKWRRTAKISKTPLLEVLLVAVVTALVNFPNVLMRAQSSKLVFDLFAECSVITDDELGICGNFSGGAYARTIILLLLAAIFGLVLAAATFGLRIPAGIILPSMAIGALYGRAVGTIVEVFWRSYPNLFIFAACEPDRECVTPGTYALIGAAAALAGATRMTVSVVVIMFELTGALTYVLPIMIAVMLSKWVGDAFGKRGIYESWIHLNGYPFLDNRDDTPVPDVPASQIMTKAQDLYTLTAVGHTIESLQDFLSSYPQRGFPVVSDHTSNILLGYITRTELAFALKSSTGGSQKHPPSTPVFFSNQPTADPLSTVDLRTWMDQTPITLNSKSTLQLTVDMFQNLGLKYVLFCDRGALQGMLTKKDIWYVLNKKDEVLEDEDIPSPRAR